ncbi:MAG: acyltransferase [Candidatus Bathyarchaeota archaeon]|nr:acyltransferase [Candidatus Bathyarchaeota archaeon]
MEPRITEFDWLKMLALFLLIFVHSDLLFVFPEIILPLKWFMVSSFFFVSGFLAVNSFHKRGVSIRNFFKSKILSLYVPFLAASLLYFVAKTTVGMVPVDFLELFSNITLLNIFDIVNSIYNWGFLWFIPYLLVFMLIFCFLEKYVKNVKIQVLLVSVLWFATILAWVYNASMKPGQLFSQYFLIFMIGVWLSKLRIYEKVLNFKTAVVTVSLLVLFVLDFSSFFTFNNATETLKALIYSNGRSMILSLSAILLVLLFLRKMRLPRNRFVELIATTSIFIYLLDPFFGFLVSNYVFGQPTVYFADAATFYLYQIARILFAFVLLPPIAKAIRSFVKK